MALSTDAILKAARSWWRMRRPCDWTESAHLDAPAVNTTTDEEGRLARAVAALVRGERQTATCQGPSCGVVLSPPRHRFCSVKCQAERRLDDRKQAQQERRRLPRQCACGMTYHVAGTRGAVPRECPACTDKRIKRLASERAAR
jgi:hypothetical protein